MKAKIYYVVNARLPNKKAYGVQIAKMCEAFIESGVDLELVIPRTRAASSATMKDFYELRVDIPTRILPGIDGYASGRFWFFLSSLVFIVTSGLYLLRERMRGKAVVYTIDMDTFSYALLIRRGFPVFAEMHTGKSRTLLNRFFFRHADGIIATSVHNTPSENGFTAPHVPILIEPNGVDLARYESMPSREEARRRLGLSSDEQSALYLGRFFDWKGLDILHDAARAMPDITFYVVGGSEAEWDAVVGGMRPPNLRIMGECGPAQVPTWLAAADALIILGTTTNEESFRHTTPMKVYEYMAARRPIVASATPALKSFIAEGDVYWYEPDDAHSLTESVRRALESADQAMLERARALAEQHSWQKRTERIMEFIRRSS